MNVARFLQPHRIYRPAGPVVCRYTTNAGQSILNNTPAILNFEDLDFDTHSCVTTGANWKWTWPAPGFAEIYVKVMLEATSQWAVGSDYGNLSLYKGGNFVSNIAFTDYYGGGSQYATLKGFDRIRGVTGEYIDIRIRQTSGVTLAVTNDGTLNYITIELKQ